MSQREHGSAGTGESLAARYLIVCNVSRNSFNSARQEIKMQVALRLIALEFPQPLEDSRQFLLVRHGQVVGRRLGLRVRHTAERITKRMELIVQIIEGGGIDTFSTFGLGSPWLSIILVRLIIVSTPLAPFACVA